MKFSIQREILLKPLQQVAGALGGRPALPILGNLLMQVRDQQLLLTGTDLEVELIATLPLEEVEQAGDITVPCRKLLDICRGLPEQALLSISVEAERMLIRSGRSRYTLSTLPAEDFPNIEDWQDEVQFSVTQGQVRHLIERTQFSMANQDVRYYLNGMLFETDEYAFRSVATDGHRMAVSSATLSDAVAKQQVILPRKGVMELVKMLDTPDDTLTLRLGASNLRVQIGHLTFTSKLVDGRFPDYRRVLPQNSTKILELDAQELRQAFSRAAILSNEKFRGVRVNLSQNELRITANNPEQEEAVEVLEIDYDDEPLEIGFNVNYVLDVLNCLKCERVRWSLTDANTSALMEDCASDQAMYVVMPIRL